MAPLHPPARRAALAVSSVVAGLGLAVSPVGAASGAAAYLYVGGGGCSDTGAGTASVPFCTIAKAAKVAVAGQTVLVSSGTYTDEVFPWHSGTSGSPITFQPAAGATVTISGAKHGFTISNQSWITVSGFTVQNSTSNAFYVYNATGIRLSGNTARASGQPGVGRDGIRDVPQLDDQLRRHRQPRDRQLRIRAST